MPLAPIILFTFHRPEHTRKTLEALSNNHLASESTLYIFADGARKGASLEQLEKIRETRAVIREKQWCGTVHVLESEVNKGLADSIVEGVTKIVNEYGKIIVLEDDIVTTPVFLTFMNSALDLYESNQEVMHLSGYNFPITADPDANTGHNTFFSQMMFCWGWATWKRAWKHYSRDAVATNNKLIASGRVKEFDYNNCGSLYSQIERNLDGSIKTWAIFWHASIFFNNGLCLVPRTSFVQNIGADNTGENEGATDAYFHKKPLCLDASVAAIPLRKDKHMEKKIEIFYKYYIDISVLGYHKMLIKHRLSAIYTQKYIFILAKPFVDLAKKILR